MLEIAEMVRFPNIEQITEPSDRELRLDAARAAVDHLKTLTDGYRESVKTREQAEVAREAYLAQQQSLRQFADDVESLRQQFMGLHASDQPHDRGIQFERLLTDLCVLFDMEPRLAYRLSNEQLDGSLSYDTDDYIVEARWRAEPTDRGDLDIFAAKVRRKGKNALGLFVSLNGFTSAALDCYREATPFLAVDGADFVPCLRRSPAMGRPVEGQEASRERNRKLHVVSGHDDVGVGECRRYEYFKHTRGA